MLKDALYYIFVYPLESFLGFILSYLYHWSGSYGLSIICLSLLVNLFLLKLFFLADNAAKSQALIKAKLDRKILEFKRVFKGGELYAYIKTLYRQNHYHPIYSLKALGGLALQVPFFVAIVSLLEFHSPELKGIRFGVIPDLLSPDGLLGGINILPFLMTIITLCNVWITSQEKSARIQGGIIAFIFLVLLYKMPSALLLYWTTSMAFSLIKSICVKYINLKQTKEVDLKLTQSKSDTAIRKIFNICFTKYSLLDSKDYKLYRNLSIFAILNLCILIFLYNPFTLYASDVNQFNPKETWNTLGALFGFFLLIFFLLVYGTSFFYRTRLLKIGVYGFCVLLTIALIYNFVLNYNIFEGKPYPNIDGLLFKGEGASISHPKAIYLDCIIGVFAMGIFCLLFRQWFASKVYFLFKIFSITFACLTLWSLYSLSTAETKIFFKNGLSDKEKKPIFQKKYIQEALNFSKTEKNLLLIISDTVQSDNFFAAINSDPKLKKMFSGFIYYPNSVAASSLTYTSVPAIIGGNYYLPLNISQRIHDNRSSGFAQETLDAFDKVITAFYKEQYHIALGASYPAKYEEMKNKFSHLKDVYIFDYQYEEPNIENLNRQLNEKNSSNIGDLISFGLFSVSSYTLRSRIYQDGGWIFGSSLYNNHLRLSLSNILPLKNFTNYLSATNKKKTFKIIHENSDHFPWMMSKQYDCMPLDDISYQQKMIFKRDELAFDNHLCYLQNLLGLFQWMKDNGVYDNTKIVVVSDHGNGGYGANTIINYPVRQARYSHSLFLVKDFNTTGDLKIEKKPLVSNADAMLPLCEELKDGCFNMKNTFNQVINQPRSVVFVFTQKIEKNNPIYGFVYEIRDGIYELSNWKDVTDKFLNSSNNKEERK